MSKAKVYFTKNITSAGLIRAYQAVGVELPSKVGVKISTGEAGGNNYLKPELIGPLVQKLNANIVECNTAYPGKRNKAADHLKVAEAHGFTQIAQVDILDGEGEFEIPVQLDAKHEDSCHLDIDIVGEGMKQYRSMLNLAHFKGHAMGGFGGALKNQSIGFASRHGKAYIHSGGKTRNATLTWVRLARQLDFLQSMAQAAKAVQDYYGGPYSGRMVYINVMNNLSIDCDCDAHPEAPCMADVGILASEDPVALDQACIDLIWQSSDPGRNHFIKRVERQQGREILPYAEAIGIGTRDYDLIEL